MELSSMAWIGRGVRQLVLVVVLSLVLGGITASPAAANQRGPAVNAANNFIFDCFASGNNPVVLSSDEDSIIVHCAFDNGSVTKCAWTASSGWKIDCWRSYVWAPEQDDPRVDIGDGGIHQGHVTDTTLPVVEEPTSTKAKAANVDANDNHRDHVSGAGQDGSKEHKHKGKGKGNGKHHGKSKGHGNGGKRR